RRRSTSSLTSRCVSAPPTSWSSKCAAFSRSRVRRSARASAGSGSNARRRSFGAGECGLWLYGASGLVCSARAGSNETTPDEVAAAMASGSTHEGPIRVRQLHSDMQQLGAIVLRDAAMASAEYHQLFAIIGDLVAPELALSDRL